MLFLLQESSGILSVQRPTRINPVSRITKQAASHPSIYPMYWQQRASFQKSLSSDGHVHVLTANDKKSYFIAANLFAQRTLRAFCAPGRPGKTRGYGHQFNYIIIIHRISCRLLAVDGCAQFLWDSYSNEAQLGNVPIQLICMVHRNALSIRLAQQRRAESIRPP